ncbi:hypothetical protein GCM10017624_04080 [Azotobacter vinelandii]|nr:hypothetical protein GCM10017624_04080 [Azotobacter vinelandii]
MALADLPLSGRRGRAGACPQAFPRGEQQVDEEFITAHIQQHLAADKGKTRPQLQQEFGDMFDQRMFDFPLLRFIGEAEKVKTIRVFQRFAGKV